MKTSTLIELLILAALAAYLFRRLSENDQEVTKLAALVNEVKTAAADSHTAAENTAAPSAGRTRPS